jgi:hypothetical protein
MLNPGAFEKSIMMLNPWTEGIRAIKLWEWNHPAAPSS